MSLKLAAAGYELELAPETGGAVLALRWWGRDILRPTTAQASSVLETACFPLVPYANRIAGGRFDWEGTPVGLPVLPDFSPHSLHGNGWQIGWEVLSRTDRGAVLEATCPAGDWPSSWRARQTFELTDAGLQLALSVTNTGGRSMPVGLGFHPCFTLGASRIVAFDADEVWLVDEMMIPRQVAKSEVIACFSGGREIDAADRIDHCYRGWPGRATISTLAGLVRLAASGNARHLHVYSSAAGASLCLEPVTHRPDAIHGEPEEMPTLAPGTAEVLTMRIGMDRDAQ